MSATLSEGNRRSRALTVQCTLYTFVVVVYAADVSCCFLCNIWGKAVLSYLHTYTYVHTICTYILPIILLYFQCEKMLAKLAKLTEIYANASVNKRSSHKLEKIKGLQASDWLIKCLSGGTTSWQAKLTKQRRGPKEANRPTAVEVLGSQSQIIVFFPVHSGPILRF